MAKGQEAKQNTLKKILESLEGSFLYNDGKEIRYNTQENGEIVQIKITLTAAKTPVSQGEDDALPNQSNEQLKTENSMINDWSDEKKNAAAAPTEDEKANVKNLLSALGL